MTKMNLDNMPKYRQLDNFTTLLIEGDNAKTFLQSHLTADLNSNNHIQAAAFCNQKGRVIATFWLIRHNDATYNIVINTPLAELTLKKLNKTAPLSRVKISIVDSLAVMALENCDKTLEDQLVKNNFAYIKLSEVLTIVILNKDINFEPLIEGATALSLEAFNHARINAHWFMLDETSSGHFLANRLKLLQNKAVSVKKGCYIGHEIIARLHFKTEEKHDIYISNKTLNLQVTDKVLVNEQDIGEVIEKLEPDSPTPIYVLSLKKDKINAFEETYK